MTSSMSSRKTQGRLASLLPNDTKSKSGMRKSLKLVDLVGIEPTTSSMPWKRAPSCATGPREKIQLLHGGFESTQFSLTGY